MEPWLKDYVTLTPTPVVGPKVPHDHIWKCPSCGLEVDDAHHHEEEETSGASR
ncbi:MAG: hypothetical protein QJR00_00790 [Bacillota bacterium]|nr:hypothetical protein [Bacillota bacterium]